MKDSLLKSLLYIYSFISSQGIEFLVLLIEIKRELFLPGPLGFLHRILSFTFSLEIQIERWFTVLSFMYLASHFMDEGVVHPWQKLNLCLTGSYCLFQYKHEHDSSSSSSCLPFLFNFARPLVGRN